MALSRLWSIGYRDLGRNRRRTLLSVLSVALGLALLLAMNCLIRGVWRDSMNTSMELQTGHLQLRSPEYDEAQLSVRPSDLLELSAEGTDLLASTSAADGVVDATPVLWVGALVSTAEESVSIRLVGMDPEAGFFGPIRSALVAGSLPGADDRGGIAMGSRLADSLGVGLGDDVQVALADADGRITEGPFAVRGVFETGVPAYDGGNILLSLDKAQAMTGTKGRASAVICMLDDADKASDVAAALSLPGVRVLTWHDLNIVASQAFQSGMTFYLLLDAIVMLVVAVIVTNTLLMAVFERVREVGILAALGMKRRQVLAMFLLEALAIGLAGVVLGVVLGSLAVTYLARVGIPIGDIADAASGMLITTTMRARFDPAVFVNISLATLAVVIVTSLYPAWFAARLEPVDALHRL